MKPKKQLTENLAYNYIICGGRDYYTFGYRDVYETDFSKYFEEQYDGVSGLLGRSIVNVCFSHKVNQYIHTPFSSFVYPRIFKHSFSNNKPRCYIFFWRHRIIFESTFMDYLKENYPGVKFVLFFQDILRKYKDLDLDMLKRRFDIIITYDEGDAKSYDLFYHPTPMSMVDVPDNPNIQESDIYFCGYAKNRYDIVLDVYRKCIALGLKCDFNVMKVPNDAEYEVGIKYWNRLFSYTENIQHILKTKCVLEVMQQGAIGFTPRLWESIVYGKHLLTNNLKVHSSEYFYPEGNHMLESVDDGSIVELISHDISYPESLKNSLSPVHLLTFIDHIIKK